MDPVSPGAGGAPSSPPDATDTAARSPSNAPPRSPSNAPPRAPSVAPPSASRLSAAPASGSTSAALPIVDEAFAAERAQKELLSEFTRLLVQTMNRQSYYEPGHPAYFVVRDELFDKLEQVMEGQPQTGYLLKRGRTPEIWVDGLSAGRAKLSDAMMPGVYEIFVPRFIEYFDRYDLVLLAFRQGITRDEFGQFIGVMTRPARAEKVELGPLLAEAGVEHISVLSSSDLETIDHDLPWQVRICLARLLRDLRAVPLFRHRRVEDIARAKRQIFADVVRPLVHVHDLKTLILHAPKIEDYIAGVEELRDLRVDDMIVKVLTHHRLIDLTRAIMDDLVKARAEGRELESMLRTILSAAQRLIDEKVADAEELLRALYEHDVLKMEQLPEDLQEWLVAESLASAREAGDNAPLPDETPRDVRVLAKVARLAFLRERIDDAVGVVRRVREIADGSEPELALVANSALETILTEAELDGAVARVEANPRLDADRYFLLGLGRVAARALVKAVAFGDRAIFGPAWHLLDAMSAAALDAVAVALGRGDLKANAARSLLALGAKHAHPGIGEAASHWTKHEDPKVRLAALAAMLRASDPGVAVALRDALADADADVALLAMKELAARFGAIDSVQERCIALLAAATPAVPAELLTGAAKWIADRPPAEPKRSIALQALQHAIDVEERPSTAFFGFSRDADVREQVIAAAAAAIGALGGEVANRRKSWLDWLRRR